MKDNPNGRFTYLMALGHLFSDLNQGAVAALLPFLIEKNHFDYAIAAGLVFAMNLVSSIIQPLFGYVSDKYNSSWVLPVAILLAGSGFSFLGIADSYAYLIVGVVICGIGIAAYHPGGAKLTNALSGEKIGKGMSIFAFGGSIGFALGPVVATTLVTKFGIPGVGYLLIPTIMLSGLFLTSLPAIGKITARVSDRGRKGADGMVPEATDDWKRFGILTVLLVGRSIAFYGLNTFLALFWIDILGQTKTAASLALSVLFIVGSMGTLTGGNLADRIGFKKIIQVSFLVLPILLFALSVTRNATFAFLLLLPIGVFLFLPSSPMVILGQRYLPNRMGLASGVTLGLAVSVGGIVAPFLGRLADVTSLVAVVQVLAVVTILPAVFSFFLVDK